MGVIGSIISYGIYFWWYRLLKNQLIRYTKREKFTNLEIMGVTALAGSASSIGSSPFWVLNTRMAIQKKDP